MSFEKQLAERTEQIEAILRQYLPEESGFQKTVLEAMNYSVLAGGKRLRPLLMWESYDLFGGEGPLVEPFLCALEMIHNYSLVHDDLPAMDNDEYRRGRRTTWYVYGEGMAVLAGDGLLNLAYERAAMAFDLAKGETEIRRVARAMQILAGKAGVYGMIGGQTADIESETGGQPLTEEVLLFIHQNKTAALIEAALMIGAVLAGAGEEEVTLMEKVARNVGVAFQIQDDILDVTSTTEVLGKPVGSDEKNHKLTYVSLKGLEESRRQVKQLSEEALSILSRLGESRENQHDTFLKELVSSLINREK